jgi:YVTN family beta-propeller protein
MLGRRSWRWAVRVAFAFGIGGLLLTTSLTAGPIAGRNSLVSAALLGSPSRDRSLANELGIAPAVQGSDRQGNIAEPNPAGPGPSGVYEPGALVATVSGLGPEPWSAAYDSENGEVYVSNDGGNTVSVLSGTSLIATIPVGSGPRGVAFDPENGTIYVANYLSGNVSIIQGTQVVGTVTVGGDPEGLAYDNFTNEVYVTNDASTEIAVLAGASEVGTISVGNDTENIAIDQGNGLVYLVGADEDGPVIVLDGTLVLARLPVGSYPYGIAYDAGDGEVYVANTFSDNISVVSGASLVPPAITVDAGLSGGIVYDPQDGYLYASVGSDLVAISSNTVAATVPNAGNSIAAAYDPGTGFVYTAFGGAATVTSTYLDLGPLLSVTSLDVGQVTTVVAPLEFLDAGVGSAAANASPSSGLACVAPVVSLGNISAVCNATIAGLYSLSITAFDLSGYPVQSSEWITVHPAPTVTPPSPTLATAVVGQIVLFSTQPSGGSGVYVSYSWSAPAGLGCAASTSNTLVCVPTSAQSGAVVSVTVTDSNRAVSRPQSITYVVGAAPGGGGSPPFASTAGYVEIGMLAVLILLGAIAVVLLARRPRAGVGTPPPQTTPPTGEPR